MAYTPKYGLPDDETLATYLEVIYIVVLRARAAAWQGDAKRAGELLDSVHELPSLLTRWPEVDEDLIWQFLEGVAKREEFGGWVERVRQEPEA